MPKKINLKEEKRIKNEEFAKKHKKFSSKDEKKKDKAKKAALKDEKWWRDYYSVSKIHQK